MLPDKQPQLESLSGTTEAESEPQTRTRYSTGARSRGGGVESPGQGGDGAQADDGGVDEKEVGDEIGMINTE